MLQGRLGATRAVLCWGTRVSYRGCEKPWKNYKQGHGCPRNVLPEDGLEAGRLVQRLLKSQLW